MDASASFVQDATLQWSKEWGHGPMLSPSELATELDSSADVMLVRRLREAIRRLNPAMSEEARATIKRFVQVRLGRRLNP